MKMTNDAVVSQVLLQKNNPTLLNILSIFLGVFLLSIMAQVSIPLPYTPVPITGQTFGVIFLALLWGWKRSGISVFIYLSIGALGLPVFAMGKSGLLWGPSFGYLIGMFFAAMTIGYFSDIGWTRSFKKALITVILGSILIYIPGLFMLSYFVPSDKILVLGLYPFILGDLIKCTLAATLASKLKKYTI